MLAAPTQLEVVTMGRISVDLYPEQIGVSLAEVRTFNKSLGGSASNVAVGAARLRRQSAVITRVGAGGEAARGGEGAGRLRLVGVGNQSGGEGGAGAREGGRGAEAPLAVGVEFETGKRGPRGLFARVRRRWVLAPPVPVETLCGLGA